MKRSLLVAALLAISLAACSKKEEAPAPLPAPATTPSLNAAPTPNSDAATPTLPAATDAAKPAGEEKPAN